jgi:hypothetical protein
MGGLDDLANAGEPAAQPFRPDLAVGALGRTDDLGAIGLGPAAMPVRALEHCVYPVRADGRLADRRQAGMRGGTGGQEGPRQGEAQGRVSGGGL